MIRDARLARLGVIGLGIALSLMLGGCPPEGPDDGPADGTSPTETSRAGRDSRNTSESGGAGGDKTESAPTDRQAPTGGPADTDTAGGGPKSPGNPGGDGAPRPPTDDGAPRGPDLPDDPKPDGPRNDGNGGGDAGNEPGNGGDDAGQGPADGEGRNEPPGGGGADLEGDELAFIEAMAAGGRRAMTRANEHVPQVTRAVFIASGANGGVLTTTGTLTFDEQGNATAYDAAPADRMVLAGAGLRVEYRIAAFAGDFSDEFQFERAHSDLRFQVTIEADCDLTIASVAGDGRFERHIDGAVMLSRGPARVSVVHGDGSRFDPDAAQLFSGTSITGTVQAGGGTIEVRELFDTKFIGSVFQFKLAIASTATRGTTVYECRDVFYAMVERDGFPVEPDFWRDNGQLLRDGVPIGDFDLDRIISPDLPSPGRVLRLKNGVEIGV